MSCFVRFGRVLFSSAGGGKERNGVLEREVTLRRSLFVVVGIGTIYCFYVARTISFNFNVCFYIGGGERCSPRFWTLEFMGGCDIVLPATGIVFVVDISSFLREAVLLAG